MINKIIKAISYHPNGTVDCVGSLIGHHLSLRKGNSLMLITSENREFIDTTFELTRSELFKIMNEKNLAIEIAPKESYQFKACGKELEEGD